MALVGTELLWRHSKTDFESVKITTSAARSGFMSKVPLIESIADFIAWASASKLEHRLPHGMAISSRDPSGYSILAPRPAFIVPLNAEPSV